jgi:hypothetical protein
VSVSAVTEPIVTCITHRSVTLVTFLSVELGEIQRVGPRCARPTEERILDHEDLGRFLALEDLQDVRMRLHVVLADATTAEPAGPDRRAPAVPAIHP